MWSRIYAGSEIGEDEKSGRGLEGESIAVDEDTKSQELFSVHEKIYSAICGSARLAHIIRTQGTSSSLPLIAL